MLEKIKEAIFQKYKKDEIRWMFLSIFDDKNSLISSNGVFYTDKSLEELITTLYHGLIEKHKNISNIVVDIILDIIDVTSPEEIKTISIKDFGILLINENKTWILLPNTKWVNNIQEWLKVIQEKNWVSGDVQVKKFTTDRFSIA